MAALAVALVLRLAAGVWWQSRLPAGQAFGFGDSQAYWELARNLSRGEELAIGPEPMRIFRTPGYPAVLAPLFWLRADPPVLWGRAVSAALATLAVAATAALAAVLFDRRTAPVAAWLAALYPEAIASGAFVLSEAPFTPLMVLHLILWTCAWRAETRLAMIAWAACGGLVAALATLMRPSWLLFVPFAGATGLVAAGDLRRHALVTGVMLLALVLGMLPWWVRNYRIAGRFVPTTLQVGASLYDGLNPDATGASDMRFVPRFIAEQRAADARDPAPRGLFEDRLDRRLRDAALAWARAHPRRALELALIKFGRMWSPLPNANEFQSLELRLALAASYAPLMGLALVGIWRYVRHGWPVWLCLLPAGYFTLLHVIFVSSIRYRQPAMLPLAVLAAAELASWRTRRIHP